MISINADSPGSRIVVALAVLSLCAEMLGDNGCAPSPPPISADDCSAACAPYPLRRWESFACECALPSPEPTP